MNRLLYRSESLLVNDIVLGTQTGYFQTEGAKEPLSMVAAVSEGHQNPGSDKCFL